MQKAVDDAEGKLSKRRAGIATGIWLAAAVAGMSCGGDNGAQDAGRAGTGQGQDSSAEAGGGQTDLRGGKGRVDPGRSPWQVVPLDQVASLCRLDAGLLETLDEAIAYPYAIVRYGLLCHEHYPLDSDVEPGSMLETHSVTKSLGAVVLGRLATMSKDLTRTGRKTGPLSDLDRVDHWLDEITFNPDAHLAHVMAMVAHNEDLSWGMKQQLYDTDGSVQINRLAEVIAAVIAQDPERFGGSVQAFTNENVFEELGTHASRWEGVRIADSWQVSLLDMARLGLLLVHDGYWDGKQLIDSEWVYRMTHPAFEDANTGYGYLTWLAANDNYGFAGAVGDPSFKFHAPLDDCTPPAVFREHPHGLSQAVSCNYGEAYSCEQRYDVGAWGAQGFGGQVIAGHRGLDLVLVAQNAGTGTLMNVLWKRVRSALIAADPVYAGDEEAFCEAYAAGEYAPDLTW